MVCEAVADVALTTEILQNWKDVTEDETHAIRTTHTTSGDSIRTTTTISVQLSKPSDYSYTCSTMYAGTELGAEIIYLYNFRTPEPYIRLVNWTKEMVRI